jgi:hypothetical protein
MQVQGEQERLQALDAGEIQKTVAGMKNRRTCFLDRPDVELLEHPVVQRIQHQQIGVQLLADKESDVFTLAVPTETAAIGRDKLELDAVVGRLETRGNVLDDLAVLERHHDDFDFIGAVIDRDHRQQFPAG